MATPVNKASVADLAGSMTQMDPEDYKRITGIANGKLTDQELYPVLALMGAFNQDISAATDPNLPGSLSSRTAAARAASDRAEQIYQNIAAAPPPEMSGSTKSIGLALGNIASVLGGNKDYAAAAQNDIQAQEKALMDARVQNLTRLRDLQQSKADAAQKTGQFELEEVSRLKRDKFDKALELLMQQMNNKDAYRRAALGADKSADTLKYINTVVDNWNQNKDANSFKLILDARNRAKVMKQGDPNDENSLVQILAKLIDEKTGVRQAEAKSIEEARGQVERWMNMPNMFATGRKLTPQAYNAIMNQVESITKEYFTDRYEPAYRNAQQVAGMYGVSPVVVYDYGQSYRSEREAYDKSPRGMADARAAAATGLGGSTATSQSNQSGAGAGSTPKPVGHTVKVRRENLGTKENGETLVYNKADNNYYWLTDAEMKQINTSGYMIAPPKK